MMKRIAAAALLFGLCSATTATAEEAPAKKPTNVYSETAVVLDTNTDSLLYSKDAEKKMYPASITKIATAIYAIEHSALDEEVTISRKAASTDGSTVYLEEGEKMSMEQLLEGLLINSGNDAAVAIAEHVAGSEDEFVDKLNTFLKEKAEVEHTHFTNAHGLFDKNHYTTAKDMAEITRYAMQNDTFRSLFGIQSMDWSSESWDTTLYNAHKMVKGELPYPEVTGGKNGFVDESRHTLVTTAEKDDVSLVVVTMKAQSKPAIYDDTKKLLDYGLDRFTSEYIPKDTVFTFDGKRFRLTSDFHYTQPINGRISEKMSADGLLTLFNRDGDEITSTKLERIDASSDLQQDHALATNGPGTVHNGSPEKGYIMLPFYLYLIIMVIAGTTFIRRRNAQ